MSVVPATLFGSAVLMVVATFATSETARIGGAGGRRTVSMDCGSNAYIVGATAQGGKDGPLGMNLVRRLTFTCRTFNGTTPGATTTKTIQASSDVAATVDVANGSGTCGNSAVVFSMAFKAGIFIDRFSTVSCITATQSQSLLNINVGGTGGNNASLSCPAAEGMYKVEARVGDAIDSVKGFCRAFGALSNLSVVTQISNSVSPKPSIAAPVTVAINSSKTLSFTVLDHTQAHSTVLVGISAATDLLGGAALNLPDFKLELLNPSGLVVQSRTFTDAKEGFVHGIQHTFNANGTWKLRVTNLKRDIGTLNIRGFSSSANP